MFLTSIGRHISRCGIAPQSFIVTRAGLNGECNRAALTIIMRQNSAVTWWVVAGPCDCLYYTERQLKQF